MCKVFILLDRDKNMSHYMQETGKKNWEKGEEKEEENNCSMK